MTNSSAALETPVTLVAANAANRDAAVALVAFVVVLFTAWVKVSENRGELRLPLNQRLLKLLYLGGRDLSQFGYRNPFFFYD